MAGSGPLCIIKGHLHCGPLKESKSNKCSHLNNQPTSTQGVCVQRLETKSGNILTYILLMQIKFMEALILSGMITVL